MLRQDGAVGSKVTVLVRQGVRLRHLLDALDRRVDETGSLNCKLVLVIGSPSTTRSSLLAELAERRHARVLGVGSALGRSLLLMPASRRHLQTQDLLRELADKAAVDGLVLFDSIELLFDRSLQLNPLDLLKRLAHARTVVAAWPGEFKDNRLSYATMGHPEYQDYGIEGVVLFEMH